MSSGPGLSADVDVIIPAYNAARFLRPAIESALGQTGVSLRVIVTDDGSTDGTGDIARSYGPRVTVVSQPNRGLPAARNSAIAVSTAPYVALLDADDLWRPGKLARQVALLRSHPEAALVFTDMTIFQGEDEVIEDGFLLATPGYRRLDRQPLGGDAHLLPASLPAAVMRDNFISPSTVLLRREALLEVGGFDEAFPVCEDAECWLRVLRTWRAIAIEDRLVLSRRWGANLSHQAERMIRGRLQLGEKVLAHPTSFPAGAQTYFRQERSVSLYKLGLVALHTGDTTTARRHLLASLRARRRVSVVVVLLSTFLGPRPRRALLRVKRVTGLALKVRPE